MANLKTFYQTYLSWQNKMLIAFSGYKGSGKDTAARVLTTEYGFTKVAFADPVREMALAIDPWIQDPDGLWWPLSEMITFVGWDVAKRDIPEVRRLLQKIGTEAVRNILGTDVWVDYLNSKFPDLFNDDTRYVITDCRFENECNFVRDSGGQIIWINRPGLTSDGHASESVVPLKHAVAELHNNETIEELEEDVRFFLFMRGIDKVDSSGNDTEAIN